MAKQVKKLRTYRKVINVFISLFKINLFFAFIPLFFLVQIVKPKNTIKKIRNYGLKGVFRNFKMRIFLAKSIALGLVIFVLLPVWIGGYILVVAEMMEKLNFVTDQIPLAGTGSMYPTFPKGEGKDPKELYKQIVGTPGMMRYPSGIELFGTRLFDYEIQRGDIISFSNEKTKELTEKENGTPSGFVKRVVALPNDKIEIRDGIFYLNGAPQKEPYISSARSTFGGPYLSDCKTLLVPEGKLFVMGDNRKGSGDSRHDLGLVNYSDIDHVIPWKKQIGNLDANWHDPSNDLDENSKIRLNEEEYLKLLNQKRKEAGVKELRYQPKLENSAKLRGAVMLEFDDLSFEATKSGYTMEKAVREAGYSNIVYGEAPALGYYTASELLENQFQFLETIDFLTNKDYQEIGISEVEGMLNGCPAQVIVQHFAGYVPPNYPREVVESWQSTLNRLREIQTGWGSLKSWGKFYEENKTDVDRINEIISIRISNISPIVVKMQNNQWLSSNENDYTYKDADLSSEQDAIATRLNSR